MRAIASLVGMVVLLVGGGTVGAVSPLNDPEEYPPDAIVNLIDPASCDPASISGVIAVVEGASSVTLTVILTDETAETTEPAGLLRQAPDDEIDLQVLPPVQSVNPIVVAGDLLGSVSGTADGEGALDYTIPIEPDRFGTIAVVANGRDSLGQPFSLRTNTEIFACPPGELPRTGNSGMTTWLQIGAIAVIAGIILAAAARRRHLRTTT